MIQDLVIIPLKQIVDERGKVMHMIRQDSAHFKGFGEVYFSVINPGKIKAWKRHKKMIQNLTVPLGEIKLAVFDDRKNSKTYKMHHILNIGEKKYFLVQIPAGLCYGFQCVSKTFSLISNCASLAHDPDEV